MTVISSFHYDLPDETRKHSHPHAHIIIPVNGVFHVKFEQHDNYIMTGQLGFVPPAVVHEYSCDGQALTLNIPPEMIKAADLVFLTEKSLIDIDDDLEPLIALIHKESTASKRKNESLRYLFYYLYDKLVEQGRIPSLAYIEENYASDISMKELAELENYNISYFTEWFKKKVGCLPSEYLRMVRIDKAKEILATTKYRIIDVAMQVGYVNSSSFTRAFREVEGITPNQYRKKAKDTIPGVSGIINKETNEKE